MLQPNCTFRALVPLSSEAFSHNDKSVPFLPIYYAYRQERTWQKIARKLKLISNAYSAEKKINLCGISGHLIDSLAFWISSSSYFRPEELFELVDRMPRLKWVYLQKTGVDGVNLDYFARRNIMLSNIGNLSSRRVAESAFAGILANIKRLPEHLAMTRSRTWCSLESKEFSQVVVLIIGAGRIAKELGTLCGAVGMHTIALTRNPSGHRGDSAIFSEIRPLSDLAAVIPKADFVVLALPLTEDTANLIDAHNLSRMKVCACLINVARGGLVDEIALCNSLRKGNLSAAYIDTPVKIPPSKFSILYRTPNLTLTHYSAANNSNALFDAYVQFSSGCIALAENRDPPNRVV